MPTLLEMTEIQGAVEKYFEWLRKLVSEPTPQYSNALFFEGERYFYIPTVPNDINRAKDGIALRNRFTRETSIPLVDLGNCRMIEFLIALAIRLNELDYINTNPNRVPYWFWRLIDNLEIRYADILRVQEVYTRLNHREYDPDGVGGLFPLISPKNDQREVEVWYQAQAYLHEFRP